MLPDDPVDRSVSGQFRILGICWIIYGLIRLIAAVCLVAYAGTATVMFGALLNRVPGPAALMDLFHILYMGMIVLSAACGIFGLLAGLTLLTGQRSSRMLALIAGVLSLCDIPLGTTLGIYTLVLLLPLRRR
jgi:hypothetical protein